MKIFADKLTQHLDKSLRPVYFIAGNEPLLIHESRQAIHEMAKQRGFEIYPSVTLDNQVDWGAIHDNAMAMSLFSSSNLIELTIPDNGMGATNAKQLVSLVEQLTDENLLLITSSKLNKQVESSKWFKTVTQNGLCVSCMTPDNSRLPQFIQQRCYRLGLQADNEAIQLLAHWHEGNLLALTQSLEKLKLIYSDNQLTLTRVKESLSRHNHFTIFHWSDALLAGKAKRSLRILKQLEAEGVEPIIMIRTIQKELTFLLNLQLELSNSSISILFDKHRIWASKRPIYTSAINRLPTKVLHRLVHQLAHIEIQAKTHYNNELWRYLQQFNIEFCLPGQIQLPSTHHY